MAEFPGIGHRQQPSLRFDSLQDACYFTDFQSDMWVGAVSDGAGSASRSDIGAEIVSREAVEALCYLISDTLPDSETAWRAVLEQCVGRVYTKLQVRAVDLNCSLNDLAATLILVAATPQLAVAAQIGDGAAVIRSASGEWHALTKPDRGEYANETVFITSPRSIDHLQFSQRVEHAGQIALFSDGIQNLALRLPEAEPSAGFFDPLFFFIDSSDLEPGEAALRDLLLSPRFSTRTDDDLTLLLASWRADES